MIRFLIPRARIAQMPSINTPTIRRLLRVDAGLSLANNPRPLCIRRLLRHVKSIHLRGMVRKPLLRMSAYGLHTRRDLRRSINAITHVSA